MEAEERGNGDQVWIRRIRLDKVSEFVGDQMSGGKPMEESPWE